jgi:glycosyltransferase involved in cell wall biosynthesis
VAYIGGISRIRGIVEVVKAMQKQSSDARLQLGGSFSEIEFEKQIRKEVGWNKVDALGWLGRNDVKGVLHDSIAGLVTLHPVINYVDALPVKMFEYMSAGLPVIASNFPLWKRIVEGNRCGLCVDPLDPQAIAEAIDYLVSHPIEAGQMGRNGQKAVLKHYNWENEEKKLIDFYNGLLS